jgi:hypothetical protein
MSTDITVRDMRARIVLEEVRRAEVLRVGDIGALPRLVNWMPEILGTAIADNVASGDFQEDAYGRLIVRREAA